MDDRELLERAAKAAGIDVMHMALSGFNIMSGPDAGRLWNPLNSDGDALRLAVALCIRITWTANCVFARRRQSAYTFEAFDNHQDRNAATRLAIVRAAAAMEGGSDA